MLLISFSGIFKPIGTAFKGISSDRFKSIVDNVVMPIAGVALGIKNAKSTQSLPPPPPVQPASLAPDATKKPWYTNPAVYLGGAAVVLLGALVLSRGSK